MSLNKIFQLCFSQGFALANWPELMLKEALCLCWAVRLRKKARRNTPLRWRVSSNKKATHTQACDGTNGVSGQKRRGARGREGHSKTSGTEEVRGRPCIKQWRSREQLQHCASNLPSTEDKVGTRSHVEPAGQSLQKPWLGEGWPRAIET